MNFPDAASTGYASAPGYAGSLADGTGLTIQSGRIYSFYSNPGKGVVGRSGAPVSDVIFLGCKFTSSGGVGTVAAVLNGDGIKFSYCTFAPDGLAGPPPGGVTLAQSYQYGIIGNGGFRSSAAALTVENCDIWGFGNALVVNGGTQAKPHRYLRNYLHDACLDNTYHTDGIGSPAGGTECYTVIAGNTISSLGNTQALAYQNSPGPASWSHFTITGNLLGGFGYTICLIGGTYGSPAAATSIVFEGNTFSTLLKPLYGPLYTNSWVTAAGSAWSGNRWLVPPGAQWGNPAHDGWTWIPGASSIPGNGDDSAYVAAGGSSVTYQQARYYSSDAAATTLASSLGPTGNPSVISVTGLPASYPFTMLIDWGLATQEAISVTSAPTGGGPYSLPCTRGTDNSTGGSGGGAHPSGAVVVHGVTAQDFTQPAAFIAGLAGFPWQFNVCAYGAVGNGALITDAVISSAGTALTTLGSTPFTSADAGKTIIVNGAGTAGFNGPLITTIAAFVSSGQVTLTAAAVTSVSGACAYYGTDDTAAFNSAIAAAGNWISGGAPKAEVYRPFPPNGLFYMIAGALITTGGANAQLPIPNIDNGGSTQKATLRFRADTDGSAFPLWSQEQAQVAGAIVSSGMYTSAANYTTNWNAFGDSCVLGSTPNMATGSGALGFPPFANIQVVVENWATVCPANDFGLQYTAINLAGCATGAINSCSALVTKNYDINTGPDKKILASGTLNGLAKGFVPPANGNNDQAEIYNPTVSGFTWGFLASEHTLVTGGRIIQCGFTFAAIGSGFKQTVGEHLIKIIGLSTEACYKGFQMVGVGESTGIFIDAELDTEGFGSGVFVEDNNTGAGLANLYGEVRVYGAYPNTIFKPLYPVSFKIRSMGNTNLGWAFAYAGFSTAGSAVAVQNPYWRDARIYVSGGTVTAISAGATLGGTGGSATTPPAMTATGLTSGSIDWPSGGWLSITQTGNPAVNVCVS